VNLSDLIASLAAFVAILSALYSRWSAKAAQRANEIAIHNERLRIYRGLLDFRAVLTTKGAGFPDEALWQFVDIALLSEFYFSDEAYKEFADLRDDANKIKALHDSWCHERESGQGDASKTAKAMNELHRKTRNRCDALAESLKPALRLEVGKPCWLI
jgi:hypothetical protein